MELAIHNAEVGGSSPPVATKFSHEIADLMQFSLINIF